MLVAATSLGPVPQSLWMMASILDEECPVVNVDTGTGHGHRSPAPCFARRDSEDPLAHGGSG
jgi:hypothetical protein